jgi:hypothetical protein
MKPEKLTPAQQRFADTSHKLIELVGLPFTGDDWTDLIRLLHAVQPGSIWGTCITWAIKQGHDMTQLVGELASQAYDNPFTMSSIVGVDATILLLRYYPR